MTTAKMTRNHSEIRAWAEFHGIAPVELLPCIVDHIPSKICLLRASVAKDHKDYRIMTWEDFFAKFDQQELTCVYDEERGGSVEILPAQKTGWRGSQTEIH